MCGRGLLLLSRPRTRCAGRVQPQRVLGYLVEACKHSTFWVTWLKHMQAQRVLGYLS